MGGVASSSTGLKNSSGWCRRTESIPFVAQVSSPGLYLLSFRGLVDEQERAEAQKLGAEMLAAETWRYADYE